MRITLSICSPYFSRLFWADQNPCQLQLPLPKFIIVLFAHIGGREWENSLMGNMSDLVLIFNPLPHPETLHSFPPFSVPHIVKVIHLIHTLEVEETTRCSSSKEKPTLATTRFPSLIRQGEGNPYMPGLSNFLIAGNLLALEANWCTACKKSCLAGSLIEIWILFMLS